MKTIKYIDEDGLKEIFRIFNETTDTIVGILNGMNERLNAADQAISELKESTAEMTDSLNTMKDKLSALNFDMGAYSESD